MGILIKGMDEIPEDGAVLVVKHDNGKAYIKHACTYGYSMELVKLSAVQPDHTADIGKKADGDCISRQAAVGVVDFECGEWRGLAKTIINKLEALPPAQPEQNGKWIYNSPTTMKCDRCGFAIKDWDWHRFKYCPNCRADMRGGEKK